jgi:class I fructose-bisphosphate aldolase
MESEVDALKLAHRAVTAGARGVVFGRKVIQAKEPARLLRALKDVGQGNTAPAEAAAQYGLE